MATALQEKKIKSADRVLEIFEMFNEQRTAVTVMDVARALNAPQSSTSELLGSLVRRGYLVRKRGERVFRPTSRVALLGAWVHPALFRNGKLLQLMRDATERRSHREDADFGFHLAITTAANNQYFETSMRALREHIAVGMKFHGLSLQTVRGGLDHVLDEHAAIHDAIRRGDAEAARAAMASHVGGSRDRLFEGRLLDLSSPR